LLGTPKFKFFTELKQDGLICDIQELEGEYTVFGQIKRQIEKSKPETLGKGILNIPQNRAGRRKAGNKDQPGTIRVSYPTAVLKTLAIY